MRASKIGEQNLSKTQKEWGFNMLNLKMYWIYLIVAASVGSGYGAGVALSPSNSELTAAIEQAQASARNCVPPTTRDDVIWKSGKFNNTRGEGF